MLVDAFSVVPEIRAARTAAGHMLLGLDFDGTLAPIVPVPDDAALPPGVAAVLAALTLRADTSVAIISGRSLADLSARLAVPGLYCAGNHGLEISGPGVRRTHPEAEAARGQLASVLERLAAQLDSIPGIIIEDKMLTASVHYRLVADAATAARVRELVHACCAAEPGIRANDGRMVVEIRPDVPWHKGRALGFLRDTLNEGTPDAPVIFIGDDVTDEDAFRELRTGGWSIIVGDPPRPDTAAAAVLADTRAVAEFLRRLL